MFETGMFEDMSFHDCGQVRDALMMLKMYDCLTEENTEMLIEVQEELLKRSKEINA